MWTPSLETSPDGHVLHGLGRAAALGVDQELGLGMLGAHLGDVVGADAGVHVAFAVPDVEARTTLGVVDQAGLALDERPQPHVRAEQDLGLGPVLLPDVIDDVDGVGGSAAVVGLGLDLGRGVDVHDDHRPGVLGLPGEQLLGGDRVGQRAAGAEVGDQHGLLRRRTEAVSAMKWTPQKAITDESVAAAARERPSESPTKSATSWSSGSS